LKTPRLSRVADVATVDSGPAFKSALFGHDGEGIRLLRGENIEPRALRWVKTRTWPEQMLSGFEHLFVEMGDLILGMDRPVISTGLKLAEVRSSDLPALLVQRVARIRPTAIDGRYLYHWLSSPHFLKHIEGSATGTQLPHVTLASIRDFEVPRFEPETERRIVGLVEDHLSRLDAADNYLAIATKRLESLRARALADVFSGEPVSLGELAVKSGYGTSEKCVVGGPGPAVVRIPNLVNGAVDLADEKRVASSTADVSGSMLEPGDVVIVRTNGSVDLIGRSAVVQPGVDAAFASYLIRYRVDPTRVLPEWVHAMLSSPKSRVLLERLAASSAGQHNLSLGKLDSVPIPLPPLHQQASHLRRLAELTGELSRLAHTSRVASKHSARLRRSILAAAFSGRLTPGTSDLSVAAEMIGA
jgi:type I restriction enzyme S subunit